MLKVEVILQNQQKVCWKSNRKVRCASNGKRLTALWAETKLSPIFYRQELGSHFFFRFFRPLPKFSLCRNVLEKQPSGMFEIRSVSTEFRCSWVYWSVTALRSFDWFLSPTCASTVSSADAKHYYGDNWLTRGAIIGSKLLIRRPLLLLTLWTVIAQKIAHFSEPSVNQVLLWA